MTQPTLLLVGGPNGSGKSTFARRFLAGHPAFTFLNADEIARELNPGDLLGGRLEAGRVFFDQLASLRAARASLVVESTLAGVSLAQQLRQFLAAGYYLHLVYVYLPTAELSVSRVAGRVLQGGHHVPAADIVRRYARSRRNFWQVYQPLAHEWQVAGNPDSAFGLVAKQQGPQLVVADPPAFQLFQAADGTAPPPAASQAARSPAGSADDIQRIGNEAVRVAQEDLRSKGIPLCFSRNGRIYYEMPDGSIQTENPYPAMLRERGLPGGE